jgi:hypothetical protein
MARPKSPSTSLPSDSKKTFSGLTSLWMMPQLCRLTRTRSSGIMTCGEEERHSKTSRGGLCVYVCVAFAVQRHCCRKGQAMSVERGTIVFSRWRWLW